MYLFGVELQNGLALRELTAFSEAIGDLAHLRLKVVSKLWLETPDKAEAKPRMLKGKKKGQN